jgi:cytoskeleton protein RodZ
MESVGELLRRARLEQGLDLASVAAHTKISANYLKAIEADDRKSLPSGFFYKSFVHQYANALSVDTQEIDAEVDRVLSADAPLPLPGQETTLPMNVPAVKLTNRFGQPGAYASAVALLAVVLVCSGIYAWWGKTRAEGSPVEKQAVAQEPRVAAPERAAVPTTLATVRPAPVPPPSRPEGLQAIPGAKVLLDLIAREETWLSVSSDGKRIFSGTLEPNQTKSVEGKEFAKLIIGNAAGIEVRLNGKPLGPLGGRGQVLTVVFTPEDFRIVPQPPKESD